MLFTGVTPALAGRFGLTAFYCASIPSVTAEVYHENNFIGTYDAETSFVGFGAKFWYGFFPFLASESSFSYIPAYTFKPEGTVPDMYVKLSLSELGFGTGIRFGINLGSVEPYGSAGIGAYRTKLTAEVADVSDSDSSTDFGFYLGGGATARLLGPVRLDVNPVYTNIADSSMEFFDFRVGIAFVL